MPLNLSARVPAEGGWRRSDLDAPVGRARDSPGAGPGRPAEFHRGGAAGRIDLRQAELFSDAIVTLTDALTAAVEAPDLTTGQLRRALTRAVLAAGAVIWFNWQIGAPVKRSLIAYDH